MPFNDNAGCQHTLVTFERLEVVAHRRGIDRIDPVERREVAVLAIKRDLVVG